jgi:hypothetical protein
LLDEDEVEGVDALGASDDVAEAGPDEVVAVLAVAPEEAELEPGMVMALTVPKIPTPATAANAMPAVRRSSTDRARSRA